MRIEHWKISIEHITLMMTSSEAETFMKVGGIYDHYLATHETKHVMKSIYIDLKLIE